MANLTSVPRLVSHDARHHLALPAVEVLVLGLGVAGPILGVAGFEGKLDKLGPKTLDLLLAGGPDVVRLDHGAQPPRGGYGLQPRHPGTHDQHPRGRQGAGGGGHHREDLGQ